MKFKKDLEIKVDNNITLKFKSTQNTLWIDESFKLKILSCDNLHIQVNFENSRPEVSFTHNTHGVVLGAGYLITKKQSESIIENIL